MLVWEILSAWLRSSIAQRLSLRRPFQRVGDDAGHPRRPVWAGGLAQVCPWSAGGDDLHDAVEFAVTMRLHGRSPIRGARTLEDVPAKRSFIFLTHVISVTALLETDVEAEFSQGLPQ